MFIIINTSNYELREKIKIVADVILSNQYEGNQFFQSSRIFVESFIIFAMFFTYKININGL